MDLEINIQVFQDLLLLEIVHANCSSTAGTQHMVEVLLSRNKISNKFRLILQLQ